MMLLMLNDMGLRHPWISEARGYGSVLTWSFFKGYE